MRTFSYGRYWARTSDPSLSIASGLGRLRRRLSRLLAPRPAKQTEAGDDTRRSDDGPERAAGHRRSVDETESLPEPYRASHDKQPSGHASGNGHGILTTSGLARFPWAGSRIRAQRAAWSKDMS